MLENIAAEAPTTTLVAAVHRAMLICSASMALIDRNARRLSVAQPSHQRPNPALALLMRSRRACRAACWMLSRWTRTCHLSRSRMTT